MGIDRARIFGFTFLLVLLCLNGPNAIQADEPAYGANSIFDTSEFALGSHTLNVVFIQDNILRDPNNSSHPPLNGGTIIHWSAAEIAERQQRINDAAAFWSAESAAIHHANAALNITVNYVNGGNAITVTDIGGEGSLIGYGDALAQIDSKYGAFSDFNAARHFSHDSRIDFGTNWGSMVFVKPYNGRASAYLNGPLVNAYEDDSSWTYAHEFGHTFGALDEYGSARTSSRSGYLWAFNTNAANNADGSPNPNSVPSIMKTRDNYDFSDGAINMVGWTDSDNDTIPDILDTMPTLTSDTSDSISRIFDLDLDAVVTPMVSPDPNEGDYTINTIESAEYRLNGGNWLAMDALDGSFGDYMESFELRLLDLARGDHTIDVRVFNSVGNFGSESFNFTAIPEPGGAFLGLACLAFSIARRRRSER